MAHRNSNTWTSYGTLPGEAPSYLKQLPQGIWDKLHRIQGFRQWWFSKSNWDTTQYKLSVAAYHVTEMNEDQVKTILWIWHGKHGRAFDECEWQQYVRPKARKKAAEYLARLERESYRDSALQIMEDPTHPDHVALWISYLLDTCASAQLTAICRVTGLSPEEVDGALARLEATGKVKRTGELVASVASARWDRVDLDEELARMKWNRVETDGLVKRMWCFDVRTGTLQAVLYDTFQVFSIREPERIEWVIDFEGEVVGRHGEGPFPLTFWDFEDADGIAFENRDPLDCRKANLMRMSPP